MADELVAILKEENATLRERIRQLETLLTPEDVDVPLEWQLANAERRIFSALTRLDVVSKEMLYQALYSDRLDLDREPDCNAVESHVSKLRKKLRPFGVVIISKRFTGYSLMNRQQYAHTPPFPLTVVARHG
ncbi:winged helix-turn-helix domain-containing protein [Rhizobium leguminosarum]|uniref:winged helix-turn-helix domain-containing protein n=1 Tax=Rhizobium leguminosarum TaxID=384 RepID=UPI0013B868CC|nr:helix-turn-helix domain-containing protein [Rhizobium leguminosarum]NEI60939.1 winged helix family transcriptional regulator [Rhizobium leguminosarum]